MVPSEMVSSCPADRLKQLTDTVRRTGGDDSTVLLLLEMRPASLDTLIVSVDHGKSYLY